jgi:hypothetical protein
MTHIVDEEGMDKAYEAGGILMQAEMLRDPELAKQYQSLKEAVPIIVPGHHDHIERIFEVMKMKYDSANLEDLSELRITSPRPIFVNCGTFNLNRKTKSEIRRAVEEGSILITTDWCLKYVVQEVFPEYLSWNKHETGPNESLPIEFAKGPIDNPNPEWFIEVSSYPIVKVNPKEVETIFFSKAFGDKYNCDPSLAVNFRVGKGGVVHYVSHLYAQMVNLRNHEDKKSGAYYASSLGFNPEILGNLGNKTTTGAVKSATSTIHSILEHTTVFMGANGVESNKKSEPVGPETVFHPIVRNESQNSLVEIVNSANVLAQDNFILVGDKLNYQLGPLTEEVLLGRSPQADVQILDPQVSKTHAKLFSLEGKVYVIDLGSRNGTYVNGKKVVSPKDLHYGDKLHLGSVDLQLKDVSASGK